MCKPLCACSWKGTRSPRVPRGVGPHPHKINNRYRRNAGPERTFQKALPCLSEVVPPASLRTRPHQNRGLNLSSDPVRKPTAQRGVDWHSWTPKAGSRNRFQMEPEKGQRLRSTNCPRCSCCSSGPDICSETATQPSGSPPGVRTQGGCHTVPGQCCRLHAAVPPAAPDWQGLHSSTAGTGGSHCGDHARPWAPTDARCHPGILQILLHSVQRPSSWGENNG